jgi:chemotaxis protein CheY-P-specific phosphatase CheC
MTPSTQFRLYQTAAATFEELAMLFPSEELTEEQKEMPFTAGVAVRFYGPKSGRLEVRTSAGVVPALTGNMLGADGAVDPQLQRDALGELGNVLCGNVVSAMTNGIGVFHLHPPRHMDPTTFSDLLEPHEECVAIGFDEGRAEVRLFLSSR